MTCDFKPGDEVVCVDNSCLPGKRWFPGSAPEKGQVYTVEDLGFDLYDDIPLVYLVGLRNNRPGGTGAYRASRFRKVQKRDLGTWLAQTTGYDEEHHSPAPAKKKRVRA